MNDWTKGSLHFHWPWLMVGLAVGVLVLLTLWLRLWWRRTPKDAVYVAHAARLRSLPRYRALATRQMALGAALTLSALVACTGAIVLAGRLQARETMNQDEATRDIMLCLDSSGSMLTIDTEVLQQFEQIVEGLRGERIGLTIWSGAAVTVFPLTDDYEFAEEQLRAAESAFSSGDPYDEAYSEFTDGTIITYRKQSLLGDGLASCVQRFDRADEKRSRAVVVASDNDPLGHGIFTLPQAAQYAADRDVVVHAIAAPTIIDRPTRAAEFQQAAESTGGTYSVLGQDGGVDTVVSAIEELEAKKIHKPPLIQVVDQPHRGTVIVGVGVALLVVVWVVQGLLALLKREEG